MTIRVAINGYGRIGKNILRSYYESNKYNIKIVAINDIGDIYSNIHLTKYDTTHGKFLKNISYKKKSMIIDNNYINFFCEKDPKKLPWKELNIDIVLECTGFFNNKKSAYEHIISGAKKVLLSAPSEDKNIDATIVYGVNDYLLKNEYKIISNSSCTTNCLATLISPIHKSIGVNNGLLTTIHSYTNDQNLIDVCHNDLRRSRSATQSIIPTKTGAASTIGLIIPDLNNKLDGYAIRVPTINVSFVDLTIITSRKTSVQEINSIINYSSKTYPLKGILAYSNKELVSVDFNHNLYSANYDSTLTKVVGNLIKISAWYDNEWAFCNRMLDVAQKMFSF